jgi:hypothetical protein
MSVGRTVVDTTPLPPPVAPNGFASVQVVPLTPPVTFVDVGGLDRRITPPPPPPPGP